MSFIDIINRLLKSIYTSKIYQYVLYRRRVYKNVYAYYKEDATCIYNYIVTRHIAFAIMIYSESLSLLNNKYNREDASTYRDGYFQSP